MISVETFRSKRLAAAIFGLCFLALGQGCGETIAQSLGEPLGEVSQGVKVVPGFRLSREPNGTPHVQTMGDYNKRYIGALQAVAIPPADRPKKFIITDYFFPGDNDSGTFQAGMQALLGIGINALKIPYDIGVKGALARAAGVQRLGGLFFEGEKKASKLLWMTFSSTRQYGLRPPPTVPIPIRTAGGGESDLDGGLRSGEGRARRGRRLRSVRPPVPGFDDLQSHRPVDDPVHQLRAGAAEAAPLFVPNRAVNKTTG